MQREPAAELRLVSLFRHRMTGRATASAEHLLAVAEIGRVGRQCALRHGRGMVRNQKAVGTSTAAAAANNINL